MTVSRKASAMEIQIFFFSCFHQFQNCFELTCAVICWNIWRRSKLDIALNLYIANCRAKVRSGAGSSLFSKKGTPLTSSIHAWCTLNCFCNNLIHQTHSWHVYPKMVHFSKNGSFLQKWHLPPKMVHSSKNGTFIQKWYSQFFEEITVNLIMNNM